MYACVFKVRVFIFLMCVCVCVRARAQIRMRLAKMFTPLSEGQRGIALLSY